MQLNNLRITDVRTLLNTLEIDFAPEVTQDEILSTDTTLIEVRTDDGDLAETHVGYAKKSVTTDILTGKSTLTLVSGAEAQTMEAMAALQARNEELESRLAAIEQMISATAVSPWS